MFLLGLLLLAATGAFTGLLIAYNTSGGPDYTVTMFGNTLGTLNSLAIFCAGIVLSLIFCFGLFLMFGGAALARRRRVARRADRRDARAARAERDALAARFDEGEGYAGDQTYAGDQRYAGDEGYIGQPGATSRRDVAAEDTAATGAPRRHRRLHVFGH